MGPASAGGEAGAEGRRPASVAGPSSGPDVPWAAARAAAVTVTSARAVPATVPRLPQAWTAPSAPAYAPPGRGRGTGPTSASEPSASTRVSAARTTGRVSRSR
ncbi:hypothetical protein [Streptomyces olivaceus]|uniref:hypothetical protein n=1 Tax=Streptomyces olivaceus TaxID=47716 RepID=UPI0036B9E6F2